MKPVNGCLFEKIGKDEVMYVQLNEGLLVSEVLMPIMLQNVLFLKPDISSFYTKSHRRAVTHVIRKASQ
jgi:hypothetical protein